MRIPLVSALCLALLSQSAWGQVRNLFPAARWHDDPIGLLYPGFTVAAGVNAAALPTAGRGTALQAAYGPSLGGHHPDRLAAAVAHSKGRMGLGAGYLALLEDPLRHMAYAGVGGSFENISFGAAVRDGDLAHFTPRLDASIIADIKTVDIGLVFYNLNHSPRMGAAIGSRSGERYNLEFSVLMPPFSGLDGSYRLTLSGQMRVGIFVAHFRTSFDTHHSEVSYTAGAAVWVAPKVNLLVQYSSYRDLVGAITVNI